MLTSFFIDPAMLPRAGSRANTPDGVFLGAAVPGPALDSLRDVRTISMTALQRLVIGAQGYATSACRGSDSHVEETIPALSCPARLGPAVERSHRIVLGSGRPTSDRSERSLQVKAFHLEPGVRRSAALNEAFSRALDRSRRTVGLDESAVN
jgi:hypothetical protein